MDWKKQQKCVMANVRVLVSMTKEERLEEIRRRLRKTKSTKAFNDKWKELEKQNPKDFTF